MLRRFWGFLQLRIPLAPSGARQGVCFRDVGYRRRRRRVVGRVTIRPVGLRTVGVGGVVVVEVRLGGCDTGVNVLREEGMSGEAERISKTDGGEHCSFSTNLVVEARTGDV
jgi:hypothetical protein